LIPNRLNSTNVKTERNNVEVKSNEEATIFFEDKLQTTQEKKRNGMSKEEEFHVATLRKNRGKVRKLLTSQVFRVHFLPKVILRVSKCIICDSSSFFKLRFLQHKQQQAKR
jgi:hypothetical protein